MRFLKETFSLNNSSGHSRFISIWRSASLFLYGLFLSLIALYLVNPQWDEYLDFAGCVGVANHLFAFLRGHITDISTITSDLEWYGNAFRWPAYLLWGLQSGLPVKIQDGSLSYDHFLFSGFSSSMHIVAVSYAVLGVYLYSRIITRLSLNRLIGWASTLCFALSPFWLANATWNLKDLPVAVALLVVEVLSLVPSDSQRKSFAGERLRYWIVTVVLALILATKYAYLPLVVLLSLLYSFSRLSAVFFAQRVSLGFRELFSFLMKALPCLVRQAALQILFAFIVSIVFTPQILGNPLYPLQAFGYFFRHPVVAIDRAQAFDFFVSRASYLVTPSVLAFAIVSCFGLFALFGWWRRRITSFRMAEHSLEKIVVFAFFGIPALLAVVPILASGRSFYGPDLRHVIWIYAPFLLCLAVLADGSMRRCSEPLKTIFQYFISLAVLIGLLEVAVIAPHFYSYLGIAPFHSGQFIDEQKLILSKYSPGRTPELHRDMILSCGNDDSCSSILGRLRQNQHESGMPRLSFPLNPSYFQSYLRLGDREYSSSSFQNLSYSLRVRESDDCSVIEYGRDWPVRLISSLETCTDGSPTSPK